MHDKDTTSNFLLPTCVNLWNELSFSELTAIAKYATTDPNIPTFLKHAAEELYGISIRYDAKKKRYRICKRAFRKKRLTLNSKLLTLLSLHDLLYSLSWLLNADHTQVECRRTKAPIATLCGKYFAPAENLTDLTLGEFLLAEDLLAPLANSASRYEVLGTKYEGDSDELRVTSEKATESPIRHSSFVIRNSEREALTLNFLAVVYAPHDKAGNRIPLTERDPEQIAKELAMQVKSKSPASSTIRNSSFVIRNSESEALTLNFLWWWHANLAVLQSTFPTLFTTEQVGSRKSEVESADTSNFQLPTSYFKKSLPSDLLYALCDGDFTKLKTIRNTNLWDAMRLLQQTINY